MFVPKRGALYLHWTWTLCVTHPSHDKSSSGSTHSNTGSLHFISALVFKILSRASWFWPFWEVVWAGMMLVYWFGGVQSDSVVLSFALDGTAEQHRLRQSHSQSPWH